AGKRTFGPAEPPGRAARTRDPPNWSKGANGKFHWPIPDKGLKKRIHRVKASTLLLWGQDDRLVPPVYADEFVRRLPGAGVQTMDGCGHAPQLEQPNRVAQMVRDCLRL